MGKKKKVTFSNDNLAWGITAAIVICISILFYLMLTKMPAVRDGLDALKSVLMPIILGCVMAYLLIPVYNALYVRIQHFAARIISRKRSVMFSKFASTLISLMLLLAVVGGLLLMAGPQVIQSLMGIVESMPSNIDKLTVIVEKLLADYPEIAQLATGTIDNVEEGLLGLFRDYVMPYVNDIIGGITTGVINAVGFLFDIIVGLIVCVYMLVGKETFSAQAKKLTYSVFRVEKANIIIADTRKIHRIFSGFISGKLLDSLIIGIITFVALSIMNTPYTVMISVIVGVTNIIPFFGPFIGAIPSALIILTIDPIKSVYFIIYAIIIQQIDGNIIGPKILGNSTGLPSFWVLFSILVGGGMFGFVGMILGVPVFATIYMFVTRAIDNELEKKDITSSTDAYVTVSHIDPESKNFIKKDSVTEILQKSENADDQEVKPHE